MQKKKIEKRTTYRAKQKNSKERKVKNKPNLLVPKIIKPVEQLSSSF